MAPRKKPVKQPRTDVRVKMAHKKLTNRGKQLQDEIDQAMGHMVPPDDD